MRVLVADACLKNHRVGLFRLSLDTFEIRAWDSERDPDPEGAPGSKPPGASFSTLTIPERAEAAQAGARLVLALKWFDAWMKWWLEVPWGLLQVAVLDPRSTLLGASWTSLAWGEPTPDLLDHPVFLHRYEPTPGWANGKALGYLVDRKHSGLRNLRRRGSLPYRHYGNLVFYSISHALAFYHCLSLTGGQKLSNRHMPLPAFGPPFDFAAAIGRCVAARVLHPALETDHGLALRVLQSLLLSVWRHTPAYAGLSGSLPAEPKA